ncbi:hypothetical protein L1887_22915 [Cichorium endivia]|nr:hypothetical protein L1887_22915 [Cichorium endivia]
MMVLVEYRNKDQEHVEWAKAFKELYVPGLTDHYPLGPVWSTTGAIVAAPPTFSDPSAPNPPNASLANLASSSSSSSRPKQGMAAIFQEISSGPVTAGLRKDTDDMKTKNRTDRAGVKNKFKRVHQKLLLKLDLQSLSL